MTRVLVARLDSLGDVLVSGPAVRAVACRPDVDEVWMLVSPQGAPAARLLPGVSRVLVWACPWITSPTPDATPESIDDLRRLIAQAAPDEAVILTSFHQSPLPLALMLRLAGVRAITGASVDFAGTLLDTRLRPGEDFDEDQPEPLRALGIAAAAGFALPPGDDGALRVRSVPAPDAAQELLEELGGSPYVVLHPGAAVPARAWPVERHAEAAESLVRRGIDVVVTGAPSEAELTRQVAAGASGGGAGVVSAGAGSAGGGAAGGAGAGSAGAGSAGAGGAKAGGAGAGGAAAGRGGDGGAGIRGRILDLGGRTDLETLAGVLAGAAVVVVGNTGPAHLAAAVGAPIVSLFSPVVPAVRWAPYGVPVRLLGDQSAGCRGTRARECPVDGHPCLTTVTAEEVVAACFDLAGEALGDGVVGAGLADVGLAGTGLAGAGQVDAELSDVGPVGAELAGVGLVGAGLAGAGLTGAGRARAREVRR